MGKLIGIIGFLGFIAIFLVMHFYPQIPRTFFGWIALVLLGLPAWMFLEWLGEIVLRSKFYGNRGSLVRVMLGVPTVIILMGIAFITISFVNQFVSYAGG